LVVEGDRCGEAAEASEDPFAGSCEGAGAVAPEGEEVLAGPEDRFDPLSDGCDVRALAGFVFAAWACEGGVALATWAANARLA
jgi:hypothetical protein